MAGIVAMLFGAGINALHFQAVIICLASYQITVLVKGRGTIKR